MVCKPEERAKHRRLHSDLDYHDEVERAAITATRPHTGRRINSAVYLEWGVLRVPPPVLETIAAHEFGIADVTAEILSPGEGRPRRLVVAVQRETTG